MVFWSLSCYKELRLTTNGFTGHTLTSWPSDPDAKYQLAKFGHVQKVKFGFKSDRAVLTFTFLFLSSPLFSLFLPHFFFLFHARHLVSFILVGIVFRKAFRILGLGERKGRWAMLSQGYKGRGSARAVTGSSGANGLKTWLKHA